MNTANTAELTVIETLKQPDFYNFTRSDLERTLTEWGEPQFRSRQLFEWVYRHGVTNPNDMSNIGRKARAVLAEKFIFPTTKTISRQISSDGTRKYLLQFESGHSVESVMIKQENRMTLCVSSQVGCGMACSFCRTGTMRLKRNLTTSEIMQQVLAVINDAKNFNDMFNNIVFMGMGEPLHNYKAVVGAIEILKDIFGLAIAPRKITVSTVGLVPAIRRFGEDGLNVNLAVSLNATTDEVRSKIMPINRAFSLAELLQCLRDYPRQGKKRITIEYVMLKGINDKPEDLKRLPKILHGIPSKINLIPYNENAGLGFNTPAREWIHHWQKTLTERGLDTTIRWSKGQDISAACGQLAVTTLAA